MVTQSDWPGPYPSVSMSLGWAGGGHHTSVWSEHRDITVNMVESVKVKSSKRKDFLNIPVAIFCLSHLNAEQIFSIDSEQCDMCQCYHVEIFYFNVGITDQAQSLSNSIFYNL